MELQIFRNPNPSEWAKMLQRPTINTADMEDIVAPILKRVKEEGDAALFELTSKLDGVELVDLKVSETEFQEAIESIDTTLKEAINTARINIEQFHIAQREPVKKIETTTGVNCWRKSVPIQRVGFYIPGGTAPLFSTILMLGVPANIAGCDEIILCTPPNKEGKIHPAILYTAHFLGIKNVFKIGGAQAIAAMAFGTASIPSVYKIFGPGNQFVTCAKQMVNAQGVAIDMPAGPSEVLVIADKSSYPSFVAADLLSQAEHGKDSQVVFITNDEQTLNLVIKELDAQLQQLDRKAFVEQSLKNSKFILVSDISEAIEISNHYAPEHLILQIEHPEFWTSKIFNAGSVFLGHYSPESVGDYASGTNHTLPTNGYAKAYSGVSLDSFVKKITFQQVNPEGLKKIGPVVETMATHELLMAHKNAVSIRLAFLAKHGQG